MLKIYSIYKNAHTHRQSPNPTLPEISMFGKMEDGAKVKPAIKINSFSGQKGKQNSSIIEYHIHLNVSFYKPDFNISDKNT